MDCGIHPPFRGVKSSHLAIKAFGTGRHGVGGASGGSARAIRRKRHGVLEIRTLIPLIPADLGPAAGVVLYAKISD